MNNWDTPIKVAVVTGEHSSPTAIHNTAVSIAKARNCMDVLIGKTGLHISIPDYYEYDTDVIDAVEISIGALADHIDNVDMQAGIHSYKCGMIQYEITYLG